MKIVGSERASLDLDGNGRPAEGDGMFGELHVSTRDASDNAQGAVRSAGVCLKDPSEAGNPQQIDLVV